MKDKIKVGCQVRLIDNSLSSLNKRSKSGGKIAIGTQGMVKAVRRRGKKIEYLVKFKGHGGLRFVGAKNIRRMYIRMTWGDFKAEVEKQGVTDELFMEEVVWYFDEKPVVVIFDSVPTNERTFSIE